MENWYAVHTKPRQEDVAEENLHRQSFKTYLPRIEELRRRSGKWRKTVAPMFPRYIFISLKLGADNIYTIHSTRGVSSLVRFGGDPIRVPSALIDTLKRTENKETGVHSTDTPFLREGDEITILEGPLAGLSGIFQTAKGEERVIILLNILGKANTVTLKRDLIWPTSRL